jgi:hypothetical protein
VVCLLRILMILTGRVMTVTLLLQLMILSDDDRVNWRSIEVGNQSGKRMKLTCLIIEFACSQDPS